MLSKFDYFGHAIFLTESLYILNAQITKIKWSDTDEEGNTMV